MGWNQGDHSPISSMRIAGLHRNHNPPEGLACHEGRSSRANRAGIGITRVGSSGRPGRGGNPRIREMTARSLRELRSTHGKSWLMPIRRKALGEGLGSWLGAELPERFSAEAE